jgi:uncharacterized hydrophobic protein (TIGR00271 family)
MKPSLFYRKLVHYFDLQHQLDNFDNIHETIVKDVVFKGTNLWILVFAIIIASVGLNMNSTAVIIGAMLISPLMGPINGIGYSLATYNFDLFRKSIKNFSFAVLAGLSASTLYFIVSPISTAHSELLARTSPTIYDVIIAFFGGMAGIVAISSRLKGNVIPGVAIATALMPPLCTAGYGLATGQLAFFFGAIFLFTINTVFIAISSVVASQLLKFPIRTDLPAKEKKRINRIISIVISLLLLPSIYFGYLLVQKENFTDRAGSYISNVSYIEGNYLLDSKIDNRSKTITLIYGGLPMQDEQKIGIISKSLDFKLKGAKVDIKQGITIGDLDKKASEIMLLKAELNKISLQLKEKENQLDSINNSKKLGQTLLEEINAIYPQIVSCGFSETSTYDYETGLFTDKKIIIFGTSKNNINISEKNKIALWLQNRLDFDNISVYYEKAY